MHCEIDVCFNKNKLAVLGNKIQSKHTYMAFGKLL